MATALPPLRPLPPPPPPPGFSSNLKPIAPKPEPPVCIICLEENNLICIQHCDVCRPYPNKIHKSCYAHWVHAKVKTYHLDHPSHTYELTNVKCPQCREDMPITKEIFDEMAMLVRIENQSLVRTRYYKKKILLYTIYAIDLKTMNTFRFFSTISSTTKFIFKKKSCTITTFFYIPSKEWDDHDMTTVYEDNEHTIDHNSKITYCNKYNFDVLKRPYGVKKIDRVHFKYSVQTIVRIHKKERLLFSTSCDKIYFNIFKVDHKYFKADIKIFY